MSGNYSQLVKYYGQLDFIEFKQFILYFLFDQSVNLTENSTDECLFTTKRN